MTLGRRERGGPMRIIEDAERSHARFMERLPSLRTAMTGIMDSIVEFKGLAFETGDERLKSFVWDLEAEAKQVQQHLDAYVSPEEREQPPS